MSFSRPSPLPARSYDLVVVGAGGVGSAAAYHASRAGRRVLLLEQFSVGHTRGSSHGGSRIIRYTHDSTDYAAQMPATFQLWRELEQISGATLLQMTGGLYLAPAGDAWLDDCRHTLAALGFPAQALDARGLARTYPQFRMPADWIGIVQEQTGMLAASRCVATMVEQAVRSGAEVREQTPVVAVTPDQEGVSVRLGNGEVVSADRAIVAAGAWATRLLPELVATPVPLRVTHQQVAYFRARDAAAHAVGALPIFIAAATDHFYGFPIWEEPGAIKVALEQSTRTVDPDGPREVDPGLLDRLAALVAAHLPGVDPDPLRAEPCLYTETPNRDFVIDRHPEHPQLVIAAGFSGRGFKHTIAVGHLLVDLAYSAPGVYPGPFWLDRYRLDRFAAQMPAA
jgi:sarcosine oxidase